MVYSRALFNSRKYLFLYILILFTSLIIVQIFQYSPKCVMRMEGVSFGYGEVLLDSLITNAGRYKKDEKRRAGINMEIGVLFLHDISIKNDYFAFIFFFLHQIFSRHFRLEETGQKGHFLSHIYNSIKPQNFISPTSRVINQLKCNIRLINLAKYHISPSSGSVFRVISDFSRDQAEFNEYLHEVFDQYLLPDQSALASGTLIGAQSAISPTFKQDLISAGLIHVVVASGYNLTVVTGFIQSFTTKLFSRKIALLLSLLGVWWYVFLALANSSILRAGWMSSISLIAKMWGRPNTAWRVLTFSVLFLGVLDPSIIFNISFQLSVFSTIGVLAVHPRLQMEESEYQQLTEHHHDQSVCGESVDPFKQSQKNFLSNVVDMFKENLRTTVGANIFTLPIILFWFGRVSLISVVANTFLLWIIPLVMSVSSVFLVVSHVHPFLAKIVALPIALLTNLFLIGVRFFAHVPFASLAVPKISLWQMTVGYGVLFLIFWKAQVFYLLRKKVRSIFSR